MKCGALPLVAGVLGMLLGSGLTCYFTHSAEKERKRAEIAAEAAAEKKAADGDPLMAMVRANLSGNWKVSSENGLVVATTGPVKYFGTISAPSSPPKDELGWAKAEEEGYADSGDFLFVIRRTSLMSKEVFQKLHTVRQEILENRIKELKGDPKNGMSIFSQKMKVADMLPLPFCYDKNSSFWLYSSDQGFHATWPASALGCVEAVRAVMGETCTPYLPIDENRPGRYDPTGGL